MIDKDKTIESAIDILFGMNFTKFEHDTVITVTITKDGVEGKMEKVDFICSHSIPFERKDRRKR